MTKTDDELPILHTSVSKRGTVVIIEMDMGDEYAAALFLNDVEERVKHSRCTSVNLVWKKD